MHLMKGILIAVLAVGLAACDPSKPGEPKTPTPKIDFNHERSMS